MLAKIEKYFEFQKYGTNLKTEIIAGITTFLATMYIIVVNPAIISKTGMSFSAVLTATVLVCFFSSLMMGLYAKNPIVVAPGMGLNAFFTFTVVLGMGINYKVALGAVFWAGIFFLLLSVFNVRTYIVKAIPQQLRFSISAGIGLFITLIGFVNAKFVVDNPATLVGISKIDAVLATFLVGLFITSYLVIKKVNGAMIIGIITTTILSIPIGRLYGNASRYNFDGAATLVNFVGIFSSPDFSLVGQLDLFNSLTIAMFPVIFAMIFTDMFDSLSTFVGVSEAAGLLDEKGEPKNIKEGLITDAVATTIAGLFGSSAGTAYIESATGVEEGGRTGMTAVVAAFLFLPFMFFSPLLSIVPAIATAPALILVGVFMMNPVTKINWKNLSDAIPAFLSMVIIPFTYSITQGIIWGFISWTVLKILNGEKDQVSLTMIIIDILAIVVLVLH